MFRFTPSLSVDAHAYVLTREGLPKFTGDLGRFKHPLNPKVIYSPGVQYVAGIGKKPPIEKSI